MTSVEHFTIAHGQTEVSLLLYVFCIQTVYLFIRIYLLLPIKRCSSFTFLFTRGLRVSIIEICHFFLLAFGCD